jgi:iron complex outermembrane receptor protein
MLRKVWGADRGLAIRRWLRASVSPLGMLAVLSWAAAGFAQAQTIAPVEKKPEQLEQIDVTAPRRKPPARRAAPGTQPAPMPAPADAPSVGEAKGANTTPVNTNVIAESVSRLGLTPRETPATVEVSYEVAASFRW